MKMARNWAWKERVEQLRIRLHASRQYLNDPIDVGVSSLFLPIPSDSSFAVFSRVNCIKSIHTIDFNRSFF